MISRNSREILMIGKLSYEQMTYFYQLADLTVTAYTSETQGLSVLELLYNETPVLCINDLAFDYIVKDDFNGYLFKDENDYINLVLKLKKDYEKMKRLRENCIENNTEYDSVHYAREVEKVYQKSLNFSNSRI